MANTKGKIIIGLGATVVFGTMGYLIYRAIRNKKIKDKIYNKLNDIQTIAGQQANLPANEQHKANLGFKSTFWRDGYNGIYPDTKYLYRSQDARDDARKIYDAIYRNDWFGATEDESTVMSIIKTMPSQGRLSQVTYAYANAKLGEDRENGDLGDDIQTALEGGWVTKDYLKELNQYINNLPY